MMYGAFSTLRNVIYGQRSHVARRTKSKISALLITSHVQLMSTGSYDPEAGHRGRSPRGCSVNWPWIGRNVRVFAIHDIVVRFVLSCTHHDMLNQRLTLSKSQTESFNRVDVISRRHIASETALEHEYEEMRDWGHHINRCTSIASFGTGKVWHLICTSKFEHITVWRWLIEVWFDFVRPCHHDNGYMDGRSQF